LGVGETAFCFSRVCSEVEVLRGGGHSLLQELDQLRVFPLEKKNDFLDQLAVFFRGNEAAAGPQAFLDLEVQTGAGAVPEIGVVAGAQRKEAAQNPESLFHRGAGSVRAEITRPVSLHPAHQRQLREFILDAEPEAEVSFVVFQIDVVAGLMLLDQGVFQDEGFFFRVGEKGFHLADFGHEELEQEAGVTGFSEVGPHPVAQVLGLPDVQDLSGLVPHEVNARARREVLDLVF